MANCDPGSGWFSYVQSTIDYLIELLDVVHDVTRISRINKYIQGLEGLRNLECHAQNWDTYSAQQKNAIARGVAESVGAILEAAAVGAFVAFAAPSIATYVVGTSLGAIGVGFAAANLLVKQGVPK